ncbi:MAG: aminopeptidase [Bacteroidota bacterium]
MSNILSKYAKLLVNYSLEIQPGERLFVKTTTLAEPLVREIFREVLKAGGYMETFFDFREKDRIFYEEANEEQLKYVPPYFKKSMETYDAYLNIRAQFNLRETATIDIAKAKINKEAQSEMWQTYFKRTATRDLKRSLCQYPTIAYAQEAGMSLEEYEKFVYNACFLYEDDPVSKWLEVRAYQQKIVDFLNQREVIRYKHPEFDISFRTKGRTWINSDGQTNMPSGEVYTSPEEDSVNGIIHFSFPAIRAGYEVEEVTLWVENGEITKWDAKRGKEYLDEIFKIPGSTRFGEAAIGTNRNIQTMTKNILFDEKIGGTVHMAIGQSYLQAGGKNTSAIHWDMITDMTNGGEIFADDELIYKNGEFLFL